MGVAVGIFGDKTNPFKNVTYLLLNFFFVAQAPDSKAFCNNFADSHSWVKGSYRVLKNHLHFCKLIALNFFCLAKLFPVDFFLLGNYFGTFAFAYFFCRKVAFCLLNIFFKVKLANRNKLSVKKYLAACNIVELYYCPSGCSFSAATLPYYRKHFAFFYVKAYTVQGTETSTVKILAQIFNAQQRFFFFHYLLPPSALRLSFILAILFARASGSSTFGALGCKSQVAAE